MVHAGQERTCRSILACNRTKRELAAAPGTLPLGYLCSASAMT
jgi:hypothetical protein